MYAAVDCTKGQNHELCKQEGVEGYPTFNHYNYGKFVEKYNGDRGVSGTKYLTYSQTCSYKPHTWFGYILTTYNTICMYTKESEWNT